MKQRTPWGVWQNADEPRRQDDETAWVTGTQGGYSPTTMRTRRANSRKDNS